MAFTIDPATFEAATGLEIVTVNVGAQNQAASATDNGTLTVRQGDVSFSMPTDVAMQLYADAIEIGRPLTSVSSENLTTQSTAPALRPPDVGGAVRSLRADLNTDFLDSSPWMVTQSEAQSAHRTFMDAGPGELAAIIKRMSGDELTEYIEVIVKVDPWALDDPTEPKLVSFVTKMARELGEREALGLVQGLSENARMELMQAFVHLPTGELAERFGAAIGPSGLRLLVQGKDAGTVIGSGILDAQLWTANITQEFKADYVQAVSTAGLPLPKKANDVVYMFGPGLFGDHLPGYLDNLERSLKAWGVNPENLRRFDYNTAEGAQDNGQRIADQIRKVHAEGQQVVIIGHSKFARDSRKALNIDPEIRQMVAGAILLQPAMSAQIAGDLLKPELRPLTEPLLHLTGGDRSAFGSIHESTQGEEPWPGREVPTVVFASTSQDPLSLLAPALGPYYRDHYGAPSDGAVSLVNQVGIKDAYVVTAPGAADHAMLGLTFTDAFEHFAVQIEAGVPDETVAELVERIASLEGGKPLQLLVDALRRGLDEPAERDRWVRKLRTLGPIIDRARRKMSSKVGHPRVDPDAMIRALVTGLHEKIAVD